MALNFKLLRTLVCIGTFLITYSLFAQSEPISVGAGMSPGTILNLPGKSGTAAAIALQADGKIPLLSSLISATPNFGWEYALMRVESNNTGKTLQTARAQYLRAGMNLNLRVYTSRKQTGLELSGGILFRKKIHESSDWLLTGNQPITYFPKSQMLVPVQLIRFTENDKRRINIFTGVVFNADNQGKLLNGFHAGLQWHWHATQRKHYYKGTHRTLQHDDVWPVQQP
jgi:ribosomal protein L19